jgi:hypothetical protein
MLTTLPPTPRRRFRRSRYLPRAVVFALGLAAGVALTFLVVVSSR